MFAYVGIFLYICYVKYGPPDVQGKLYLLYFSTGFVWSGRGDAHEMAVMTTTDKRQDNDDIHVFLHSVLWHLQCHLFGDRLGLEGGLEIAVPASSCWQVKRANRL